jgi:hypothetical protein
LLDALQMMHAENFLHRDIAPDNIIVRADGSPVLLDFGAARRAVAEMSRTMTGIVKAGYSPHEQYSSDSRLQGPWSDLYALGGTLYRAVTGNPPEEATLRVDEDHMPPASQVARKSGYRPGFLSAIDACLKVRHSERLRSVAQLRPLMLGRKLQPRPGLRFVEALKAPSKTPPQRASARPPSRSGQPSPTRRTTPSVGQPGAARRWPAVAAAILAVLGGAYGGYEYTRWQPIDAVDAQRRAAQAAVAKRVEEERIRQEAEARRLAEAAAAQKRADEERARQDAEAKRIAEAAAAQKRADEERARQDAEARRIAEAAAKQKADEERARQEAEAKRIAEAAAAQKRADEERARRDAEARRIAEAAAKQKADEERARQEAEAKRIAEAAAKKKADEEAAAKRAEEARVAAAKVAAEEAAEAQKSKTEAPQRVASTVLNAEERATFVKRIQEVLKQSKCYEGAINGSSDDAQRSLDRYIKSAQLQGKRRPARIELAKASAGDFDSWLKEADDIKGGLCSPPHEKRPTASKPQHREVPRRAQAAEPRARPSSGGGGGRIGPIQGIQ